jgi:hypothetical protein
VAWSLACDDIEEELAGRGSPERLEVDVSVVEQAEAGPEQDRRSPLNSPVTSHPFAAGERPPHPLNTSLL